MVFITEVVSLERSKNEYCAFHISCQDFMRVFLLFWFIYVKEIVVEATTHSSCSGQLK